MLYMSLKESLVAGVMSINESVSIQPALIWSTCSKKDESGTTEIIAEINQAVIQSTGAPHMNICTDLQGGKFVAR